MINGFFERQSATASGTRNRGGVQIQLVAIHSLVLSKLGLIFSGLNRYILERTNRTLMSQSGCYKTSKCRAS